MDSTPPRGLPAGYRDVYRWVRQEEERCSSRAELARVLGVSTHTLQRILVDGEVPDFTRAQGSRLVLAWVRILSHPAQARLHCHETRTPFTALFVVRFSFGSRRRAGPAQHHSHHGR